IGAAVAFASALAQPLLLNPDYPYLMLVPFIVLMPLITISNTMANAVVPDICDVDELATGERREGLFTAVMGFVAKLEISLTILVVSYLITFAGFDSALENRWKETIDGKPASVRPFNPANSVVFKFRAGEPATFDSFSVHVADPAANNLKTFELLAGDQSPTGEFRSIGRFDVADAATPGEQVFTFPSVTAKYLRFNLIAGQRPKGPVSLSEFVVSAAGSAGLATTDSVSTVDTAGFSGSITGVISGNGPLTKIGIGALDLTGTNTFTRAVNLVSGDPALNLIAASNGAGIVLITQDDAALKKMFWLAVIPNVVFTFAALVLALRFPMTEASMAEVRRKLDERHQAHPETAPETASGPASQ
ncbi:MAG: MFS transporter, partial [Burkholderiales bacterium]|nr:MFS transporter [Phycisphaerae bacterium]